MPTPVNLTALPPDPKDYFELDHHFSFLDDAVKAGTHTPLAATQSKLRMLDVFQKSAKNAPYVGDMIHTLRTISGDSDMQISYRYSADLVTEALSHLPTLKDLSAQIDNLNGRTPTEENAIGEGLLYPDEALAGPPHQGSPEVGYHSPLTRTACQLADLIGDFKRTNIEVKSLLTYESHIVIYQKPYPMVETLYAPAVELTYVAKQAQVMTAIINNLFEP